MALSLDDFRTLPHIRSRAWWTMRSMKIEWAVSQAMAQGYTGEHSEWMLRLHVAKSLEPAPKAPLPISRGELRYR